MAAAGQPGNTASLEWDWQSCKHCTKTEIIFCHSDEPNRYGIKTNMEILLGLLLTRYRRSHPTLVESWTWTVGTLPVYSVAKQNAGCLDTLFISEMCL